MIATSAGPCDSPAVVSVSVTPPSSGWLPRRLPRFPSGGASVGGPHRLDRLLHARPALERRGALAHEHLEAVDDRGAPGFLRGCDERRRLAVRPVGEVDD